MTDLTIGTLRASATDWPAPDEVPVMLQHLADQRLGAALSGQSLPDGDWCIRRLDVPVVLDPDRPLSALETDWADQIVTILRQSLTDGSADVVRYERPEEAVDDLLRGLVTGRAERVWAWRQVGLLTPDDPEPVSDPRTLFLRVLDRLPQGVAGAMARLLAAVGVVPAHRLLGREGWAVVATLAAREAGADWRLSELTVDAGPTASGAADQDASDATGSVSAAAGGRLPQPVADDSIALSAARVASGALAAAFRHSGLRADRATLEAWAVLVLAAVDPVLLRRIGGLQPGLVATVADGLRSPSAGRAGLAAHSPARSARPSHQNARVDDQTGADASTPRPAVGARQADASARPGSDPRGLDGSQPPGTAVTSSDASERPSEPNPDTVATRWGGLLFLLNTASAAGLPKVLDEPPLAARPASWVLHQLGLALVPAAADDPAVLAFAGLIAPPPDDAADDAERAALTLCAIGWAASTAALLRTEGDERDDFTIVRGLAGRDATILHEPGWVEVRLSLDDVDLDIRRAGLDVDPGWVWWLGQVVRFRYE